MPRSNMKAQYWVIGGEYEDGDFTRIIDGTSRVYGPFDCHTAATQAWRDRAQASRHQAMTRYTIATSAAASAAVGIMARA